MAWAQLPCGVLLWSDCSVGLLARPRAVAPGAASLAPLRTRVRTRGPIRAGLPSGDEARVIYVE